jgi:hypothetical protein
LVFSRMFGLVMHILDYGLCYLCINFLETSIASGLVQSEKKAITFSVFSLKKHFHGIKKVCFHYVIACSAPRV